MTFFLSSRLQWMATNQSDGRTQNFPPNVVSHPSSSGGVIEAWEYVVGIELTAAPRVCVYIDTHMIVYLSPTPGMMGMASDNFKSG